MNAGGHLTNPTHGTCGTVETCLSEGHRGQELYETLDGVYYTLQVWSCHCRLRGAGGELTLLLFFAKGCLSELAWTTRPLREGSSVPASSVGEYIASRVLCTRAYHQQGLVWQYYCYCHFFLLPSPYAGLSSITRRGRRKDRPTVGTCFAIHSSPAKISPHSKVSDHR